MLLLLLLLSFSLFLVEVEVVFLDGTAPDPCAEYAAAGSLKVEHFTLMPDEWDRSTTVILAANNLIFASWPINGRDGSMETGGGAFRNAMGGGQPVTKANRVSYFLFYSGILIIAEHGAQGQPAGTTDRHTYVVTTEANGYMTF